MILSSNFRQPNQIVRITKVQEFLFLKKYLNKELGLVQAMGYNDW